MDQHKEFQILREFLHQNNIRNLPVSPTYTLYELLGLTPSSNENEITQAYIKLLRTITETNPDADLSLASLLLGKLYTQYIAALKYKFDETRRPDKLLDFIDQHKDKVQEPFTRNQKSIIKKKATTKEYFRVLDITLEQRNKETLETQHAKVCRQIILSEATEDKIIAAITDLNYIFGIFVDTDEHKTYLDWYQSSHTSLNKFIAARRIALAPKALPELKIATTSFDENQPLFFEINKIVKEKTITLDDDTKKDIQRVQEYLTQQIKFAPYSEIVIPHIAEYIAYYAFCKAKIETLKDPLQKYQHGQIYAKRLKILGNAGMDTIKNDIDADMDKKYPKNISSHIINIVESILTAFFCGLVGALIGGTVGLIGGVAGVIFGASIGAALGTGIKAFLPTDSWQWSFRKLAPSPESKSKTTTLPQYASAHKISFDKEHGKSTLPVVFEHFQTQFNTHLNKVAPPPPKPDFSFSGKAVGV